MKKILPLIFYSLLSSSFLIAQNNIEYMDSLINGEMRPIVVAGYNYSTLSLEVNNTKPKAIPSHGFHIGAMFMRQLPRRISVEAGLIISTSGASYDFSDDLILYDNNNDVILSNYEIHQKVSTYNFIFPLKLKHRIGYKRLHYYYEYGLYFGVALESNLLSSYTYTDEYINGDIYTGTIDETINTTYESGNTFDFGVNIGGGLELNSRWSFGVNFAYGFINQAVNEIDNLNWAYYYINNTRFKNRVFTVSLGYIFDKIQ